MPRSLTWIAAALAVAASPAASLAYPYELYAKYTQKGTPTSDPASRSVTLGAESPLLPADPTNASFDGIYLRAKSDALARSELSLFDSIVVKPCIAGKCDKQIVLRPSQYLADTPQPVLVYAPPPAYPEVHARVLGLNIEVSPHFSLAYVCGQEQQLREERGKPLCSTPKAMEHGLKTVSVKKDCALGSIDFEYVRVLRRLDTSKEAGASNFGIYAYATLFSRGLTTEAGEPIVYSTCPGVYDQIDWAQVAKLPHMDAKAGPDEAHSKERMKLLPLLIARIKKQLSEDIVAETLQGESRAHIYARLTHTLTLLQNASDLRFREYEARGPRPLGTIVDKASAIMVETEPTSDFCSQLPGCNTAFARSFSARVSYKDKKGNNVDRDSKLVVQGNGWQIVPNLSDNIGDEVTVTVSYVNKVDRYDILTATTRVENLGVITTFPVVTEVVSAIDKSAANAADISTQSSIPISWAINLAHGEPAHVAVTLPWMIGINTRDAPRLADVVKVFPHISLILPLASSTTKGASVAFGAGIALANAFTFSFATTVRDNPQAFFLVGISAPDLAKSFMK